MRNEESKLKIPGKTLDFSMKRAEIADTLPALSLNMIDPNIRILPALLQHEATHMRTEVEAKLESLS